MRNSITKLLLLNRYPEEYLDTVPWCKAAAYLTDWTVFISIGRAGRSSSCTVDCLGRRLVRRNALEQITY